MKTRFERDSRGRRIFAEKAAGRFFVPEGNSCDGGTCLNDVHSGRVQGVPNRLVNFLVKHLVKHSKKMILLVKVNGKNKGYFSPPLLKLARNSSFALRENGRV